MMVTLGLELVFTLKPERVAVPRVALVLSQSAPVPLNSFESLYLLVIMALRISTLSMVLFHERF